MLDVVNRLADGFVAIPVIAACRRGGVFAALSGEPRGVSELSRTLGANEGNLRVALRLLDGLGWVDAVDEETVRLTGPAAASAMQIPDDLDAMFGGLPGDVIGDGAALAPWFARCEEGWLIGGAAHPLADLLDGALLAPVMVELYRRGGSRSLQAGEDPFGPAATQALLRLFAARGWAEPDGPRPRLNPAGEYLADSGGKLGVTVSYWPMLRQATTLLFGDSASVFVRDADGHELHLDRRLNVFGSSAQHGSFFREMEDAVVGYFDSLPLEAQPTHIADLGCGDGTLLKRLYQAVATRTRRGPALAEHPLTLIAADYNEASLEQARRGLESLPHLTVQADIGDPAGFVANLAALGVDPDGVLHVRSFVDHDRPLLPPLDMAALVRRSGLTEAGVHVDAEGGSVASAVAVQSLVEHLARWRDVVGRHGLLVLEVHCLRPATIRRLHRQTEALHFDAYHSFARQHLVEAPTFLLAAVEAGLLPQSQAALRFPRLAGYTRITLNLFAPIPYRIRLAVADDLPALLALEEAALSAELRSSEVQIRARIENFPKGQLVAERDGEVIGAIYTQRIADPDVLQRATAEQVETLHRDDGPVGQLLWLLAHPQWRDRIDAEKLLDFALDYFAVMDGVQRVVGVTRCRDYARRTDRALSHAAYVGLRDGNGMPIDPILLMHFSHGASIERVLENYRPRDRGNEGAGVLIAYRLADRRASRAAAAEPASALATGRKLETIVREAVERVLGATRRDGYQPDRPLMSMGLESLDLLELRRSLGDALGVALDPTFFFRHGTPGAVVRYFAARLEPAASAAPTPPAPLPELPSAPKTDSDGYAIVGLACRMPGGADDPAAFWRLLAQGGDGVANIDAQRWNLLEQGGVPLDGLPREGALLAHVDRFDAGFFRISPREAMLLDPQQRLLLETAWQALEDAAIASDAIAGSATGLFLGLMGHDYETLVLRSGAGELDGHFATGNAGSIAAGRIAHFFDWHGPAVTIDTACSSSLVAVHQACRALRVGDCTMALAGGVNLTLTASASLSYLRAGMLSPDGRCKTFDAAADGYGRGEGVGVVVLKRLADAERDGDRVLAVIRGSAVNQDGTGIGLTAPNETAQSNLIRSALADARIAPGEVLYLEAHGTGTVLGDPIEVGAAAAALGEGRRGGNRLLLGSVKANIGHLEAAAGIAGLIKVVLALRAGELPGQAHFVTPNPHIAWSELPVEVVRSRRAWPAGRRLAGVSSFGFSGTNAHVVIEGVAEPAAPAATLAERPAQVLPLSAKSASALCELAGRYADWVDGAEEAALGDACFTAGIGRNHFAHRAAVVGATRTEFAAALAALRTGTPHPALHLAAARRGRPRVGVLFTGQGSQFAGMARELHAAEPVFREAVDRCCAATEALGLAGPKLRAVLLAAPGSALSALLDRTTYTQPALYALQCGLWALLRSWGLQAEAALGHSVGEFAAAHAAGVFSLEDGARLVARRGALMGALPAGGAMAVVFSPPEAVAAALARLNAQAGEPGLSLAAENGTHRVVSGPASLVDALVGEFSQAGVRCQRLTVSHAFHSALLEPMLDELEAAAATVAHRPAELSLVSNLTGAAFAAGTAPDAAYWRRHARAPVRYADGVAALAGLGIDVLLELGPRPVLGPLALGCWPSASPPAVVSSLRPGVADERALAEAVAGLYAAGGTIDFAAREAGRGRRRIGLPGYPFERVRHWVEAPRARAAGVGHPLLGTEHRLASGEVSWTQLLSAAEPGWAADHAVFSAVIAPGALHACLAAATDGLPVSVRDAQIHAPLLLTGEPVEVQFLLAAEAAGGRSWRVFSRPAGAAAATPWKLHARGEVANGAAVEVPAEAAALDAAALSERDVEEFYAGMAAIGIGYGPSFRGVERLWGGAGVSRGEIAAPEGVAGPGPALHPTVLDACFQVLMAALPEAGQRQDPYVPLGWERIELWAAAPRRVVCEARVREAGFAETVVADLWLRDAAGASFGRVTGLLLKRATRQALLAAAGAAAGVDELLYEVVWREVPAPGGAAAALAAPADVAEAVRPRLPALAAGAGYDAARQARLEALLERAARAHALAGLLRLGWSPVPGELVEAEPLRARLGVLPAHARLFSRLLGLLGEAGLLAADGAGWRVAASGLPPDAELASVTAAAAAEGHDGAIAWVLLARCGPALAGVLRGETAPLGLLFPEREVGATELYREAPVARLMNALLAEAVERAVAALPPGRRLRVLEVGAGTGGTTGAVLPRLPRERTDYVYTDVSAGFFAGAEARFAAYPFLDFRVLDIERDPAAQGFAAGGYDLVLASNVIHATRDLVGALAHCRALLAPGGALVLLEELRRRGWLDLTFGLLDGWWRFADAPLRTEQALLDPARWRTALAAAGFAETALLPADVSEAQAVLLARMPWAAAAEPPGRWLLAADAGGMAERLAAGLQARGQRATLVRPAEVADWHELLAALPAEPKLRGVVHLAALDAAGADSSTERLAADAEAVVGSALALAQALIRRDAPPSAGLWFVTEGAQVVQGEPAAKLVGAALWGMARTLAREHPELHVRRLDLPAGPETAGLETAGLETAADPGALLDELLSPDGETEAAWRGTARLAPRLVRAGRDAERLAVPAEPGWRLAKGAERTLAGLAIERIVHAPPGPGEIAVAVEAAGINFRDVLDALGMVPVDAGPLGGEFCGRVLALGDGVAGFVPGERVVGFGAGCFGERVTTPASLVAPCPAGLAPAAAGGLPIVFATAALAFEISRLCAGERVLIHAGAGGVGLAAIQLARAAGADVFATASAAKQAFLRALGVRHVFDSRSTGFAEKILAATGGRGVDVVLNSLTGEGFVAASLSCLAQGGRFVEIGKRGIWTPAEMAAARPDVAYTVLAVDRLTAEHPERVGACLRAVLARVAAGELSALPTASLPLAKARTAMRRMQQARHVGKLVLTVPALPGATVRPGATYLITGGLGGIGLAVAAWLADRGATHLALNGRRAPDTAAQAAVDALRRRGVTVELLLADVSRPQEVDRLLAKLDARMPPLTGIIHSVGLLRDAAVANQDWGRFAAVLGPKVLGAWQLHRATLDRRLDMFVLFASTAGLLGTRGQANHAAANLFLDQLARHRRALGLAGLSLDWGAWSEIGEAAERRASLETSLAAAGIGWITPALGLAAFARALEADAAHLAVLAADWPRVAATGAAAPLLGELLHAEPAAQSRAPDRTTRAAPIPQRLARTPAAQRSHLLLEWLANTLKTILRLPEAPEPDIRFSDLGMDSLMSVELRNRLNADLQLDPPLPASALFDHPSLAELARIIEAQLGIADAEPRAEPVAAPPAAPAPREIVRAFPNERLSVASENQPGAVAIVGMACRFPQAPDLAAYWRLLVEGRSAVAPIPPARRDIVPLQDGAPESWWAGLLDDIEDFDPLHFRISPREAPYIDPQHRLLLEAAWHALEHAGIPAAELVGSRTGVFIGIGSSDFGTRHANDPGVVTNFSGTGSGPFAAANRISHAFALNGPSFAVNTACTSALTALHLAVTSLRTGDCDLALVGGVNLLLHPSEFTSLSKAGVLSPTGQCRSFSADADGYVRSEGCGVVVLRRHADALAAGDRIGALIRGTAISHVGASNGLSAPNGPAQEAGMREAAARAGIDPAEIDYLEAQGTGTSLGDAIEMGAIRNVMAPGRDPARPLRVGAVKSNIGNPEEASGMAGLIKTVLAMQHGLIPPTLHFRALNPTIRLGNAPIRVVAKAETWQRGPRDRRTAVVNGFGFAGATAHVVLEEGLVPPTAAEDAVPPFVLALRARTEANLRRMAGQYADALSACSAADVATFCAAANTGRGDLGHRLALVGADRDTLVLRLRAVAEGKSAAGVYGPGKPGRRKRRIAFLFSCQESLGAALVDDMYAGEPTFREVIDRCAAVFERASQRPLRASLIAPAAADAQPTLYALQSALAALWESWGVEPDYVLGHGVGELAAACSAGVLDLESGMTLAIERARLTERLQTDASMAVIEARDGRVATSADGAPALQAFEAVAAGLPHAAAQRRFFASASGVEARAPVEDWPAYWREHAQRPGDFAAAMRRLASTDADVFVEIGPTPSLIGIGRQCLPERDALWLPSLRTGEVPGRTALREAVAALFTAGCPVDFVALHGSRGGAPIDVPLYPFERRRYSLDDVTEGTGAADQSEGS